MRWLRVGAYMVDASALLALAHVCRPERCTRAKTCCSSYDVRVNKREAAAAIGLLSEAARYASTLREDGDFADPIEECDGGQSLATREDGACVYSYRGGDGGVRCGLHSAALDLGLRPERAKPRSCVLWPLAIAEGRPPILTVMEDAALFPCNRRRVPGKTLHPGVAALIADALGPQYLMKLEMALAIHTMERD